MRSHAIREPTKGPAAYDRTWTSKQYKLRARIDYPVQYTRVDCGQISLQYHSIRYSNSDMIKNLQIEINKLYNIIYDTATGPVRCGIQIQIEKERGNFGQQFCHSNSGDPTRVRYIRDSSYATSS